MSTLSNPSWENKYITVNSIKLHYVTKGDGPLMLMLHGFPSFWYSWKYQIEEFSQDYKVVALDLRGYNDSDKPESKSAYHIKVLIQDIVEVIQTLDYEQCILLGHDWGGGLAWSVANAHPNLVQKLVVLNMPHPKLLAKAIRYPPQLIRTYYFFAFQIDKIPEKLLLSNDYKNVRDLFTHETNNGAFTNSDIQLFIDSIAKPGSLNAMINYYRNIFEPKFFWKRTQRII
ncbi:alpha/beta hydrolase [Acaryochloris sp. 'Moss Beach']|uniref:alpha/beta fold hydrolase n=1 Tax=Acaryochloris sp. 'Moss Beach' TaxID=2740837 RepID=UPI0028F42AA4|nr:alpha/beta hydrolase [Acaryochloris sp. 'Moss Beach']